MSSIIEARGLKKNYKDKVVLDGVDLDFQEHRIHGILGRNGVGKSTLLAIIAGQIAPSGGTVLIDATEPFDNGATMARTVYAGIDVPYPPSWKVADILAVAAKRWETWNEQVAREIAGEFGLPMDERYVKLSRGQRSMVGVVVGLAARCDVTLLDEPYVGLDVHNREVFYAALMREMEQHPRTVLLATHHIEESAKVLDTISVLNREGTVAHRLDVEDIADAYVLAIAPSLPEIPGELRRTEAPGQVQAIIPRGTEVLATKRPAPLDDVIATLIERS